MINYKYNKYKNKYLSNKIVGGTRNDYDFPNIDKLNFALKYINKESIPTEEELSNYFDMPKYIKYSEFIKKKQEYNLSCNLGLSFYNTDNTCWIITILTPLLFSDETSIDIINNLYNLLKNNHTLYYDNLIKYYPFLLENNTKDDLHIIIYELCLYIYNNYYQIILNKYYDEPLTLICPNIIIKLKVLFNIDPTIIEAYNDEIFFYYNLLSIVLLNKYISFNNIDIIYDMQLYIKKKNYIGFVISIFNHIFSIYYCNNIVFISNNNEIIQYKNNNFFIITDDINNNIVIKSKIILYIINNCILGMVNQLKKDDLLILCKKIYYIYNIYFKHIRNNDIDPRVTSDDKELMYKKILNYRFYNKIIKTLSNILQIINDITNLNYNNININELDIYYIIICFIKLENDYQILSSEVDPIIIAKDLELKNNLLQILNKLRILLFQNKDELDNMANNNYYNQILKLELILNDNIIIKELQLNPI